MLIKNKCSAHTCISIYFMYVVCVLYNNVFLSYSYETCHISKQFENSWFHTYLYQSYRFFSIVLIYYDYIKELLVTVRSSWFIWVTLQWPYMSLTIVVKNYILHIIYNYCPILYFVNYYVYNILFITVTHHCSKFSSSYFVKQS